MVEIRVDYAGELRCVARHGPSGAEFRTDAPVDNEGRGESFSPTDLVATALGTCMLTVMGIAARKNGWDVGGASARVVKGMVADPRRRVGRLEVEVAVPEDPGAEARAKLEEVARHCPVAESLSPSIDVPVRFVWGEDRAAR